MTHYWNTQKNIPQILSVQKSSEALISGQHRRSSALTVSQLAFTDGSNVLPVISG